MTLLLLITAAAGAWADDTNPEVTIDNTKTQPTASFTMPASDVTVNYTLVRDMQDQTNPVTFKGLPTTTTAPIIVKKGDDGKYQPIEELTIQLIDPLISGDNKNIINADGITVTIEQKNENNEWIAVNSTFDAFLADMQPGTYRLTATPKDATSPYDGTVTTSEFTVVEQYDLTVKPANDFSKGKIESVTVGTESVTIDANTGKATKTGIAPNTDVKIKAKPGYIIEKVEAKGPEPADKGHALSASAVGEIVGSDGKAYAVADKDDLPSGVTAVAMVAYKSGSNGLAIQLNASPVRKNWNDAKTYASGLTAVPGGTWRLPSKADWQNMFLGCAKSGDVTSASDNMNPIAGFGEKIAATGITWYIDSYWSSTASGSNAWGVGVGGGQAVFFEGDTSETNKYSVLGCLAF